GAWEGGGGGAASATTPAKKKRRVRQHPESSFIDLTGVPSQPLILKNALSQKVFKDNTRRRPVKSGSSKYTGVYYDKGTRKWKAQIWAEGKVRSIGYYEREEEAAADYARAAFKYKSKNTSNGGDRLYGGLDLSNVPEQPLIRSSAASGYQGVKKMKGRWQARIATENGEAPKTLGTFDTVEEAAGVYARAAYYLQRRGKKKGSSNPASSRGQLGDGTNMDDGEILFGGSEDNAVEVAIIVGGSDGSSSALGLSGFSGDNADNVVAV
ncbi:hypothetical protein ACHAWF_009147, partial [Thalassiosira exigua]